MSRRAFELWWCAIAVMVAVAAGALAGRQWLAPAPADHPPITAEQALDVMRNAASSHQETLAGFHVIAINGPYVRAVVNVPEEYTQDMPVDIVFDYGWHLERVEPVRGKQPGPG